MQKPASDSMECAGETKILVGVTMKKTKSVEKMERLIGINAKPNAKE